MPPSLRKLSSTSVGSPELSDAGVPKWASTSDSGSQPGASGEAESPIRLLGSTNSNSGRGSRSGLTGSKLRVMSASGSNLPVTISPGPNWGSTCPGGWACLWVRVSLGLITVGVCSYSSKSDSTVIMGESSAGFVACSVASAGVESLDSARSGRFNISVSIWLRSRIPS